MASSATVPSADTVVPEDEGRRRCNDTWYFLNAFTRGTPVRCAPQGGRIQCASQVDNSARCQWGHLVERPMNYQPLRGILSANYVVEATCPGWPANDGSDACEQLRCYEPKSADFCSPLSPLPPLDVHSAMVLTVFVDEAGATSFSTQTSRSRWYENKVIVALGGVAMTIMVLCVCLCACGLKLRASRRSLRLLMSHERKAHRYQCARPHTSCSTALGRLPRLRSSSMEAGEAPGAVAVVSQTPQLCETAQGDTDGGFQLRSESAPGPVLEAATRDPPTTHDQPAALAAACAAAADLPAWDIMYVEDGDEVQMEVGASSALGISAL